MTKLLLVLAAVFGTACAFQDISVVEWLKQHGFNEMSALLHTSGMDAELSNAGSFTIFAPTDAAFHQLGSQLTSLQANPTELRRVLNYHVREFILVPVITGYKSVHTLLQGEDIILHKISNTEAFINNGTRLIPTNDNVCNNGVVQPINAVLFPPTNQHRLNIAQILIRDGTKYRDFALSLLLTGILPILETGEFTVFVPNNNAIAPWASAMLDVNIGFEVSLPQIIEEMKYYIVPGARKLATLRHVHQLYTLHGLPLNVTSNSAGDIMINEAHIIEGDIEASNGIIHVVDHVIPPQDIIDAVYRNHTELLPPEFHLSGNP